MPRNQSKVLEVVDTVLAVQEAELAEIRARQMLAVETRTATGSGDVNHTFLLERKHRLVFVRCHFTGNAGVADFVLAVDSEAGSAHDAVLFTVAGAGKDHDVHLRIGGGDIEEPSAWTFQRDDALRLTWTNPDSGNITWGIEVGLAPAS